MYWLERLKKINAFWQYDENSNLHVRTSESGKHCDVYLNTNEIVCNVLLVEEIINDVFKLEIREQNLSVDWVVSYPPFGLPLAYSLARAVNARFAYVETKLENKCYFDIRKGEKVIIIADDIYSGGSIEKTIKGLQEKQADILSPIMSIANFSKKSSILGKEIFALIEMEINLWDEANCPLCQSGSLAVLPRPNWSKLTEYRSR